MGVSENKLSVDNENPPNNQAYVLFMITLEEEYNMTSHIV
jgi:hypothetical protein